MFSLRSEVILGAPTGPQLPERRSLTAFIEGVSVNLKIPPVIHDLILGTRLKN